MNMNMKMATHAGTWHLYTSTIRNYRRAAYGAQHMLNKNHSLGIELNHKK